MSAAGAMTLKTRLMIGLVLLIPFTSIAFGALIFALASSNPGAEPLAAPEAPLSKTSWRTAQP